MSLDELLVHEDQLIAFRDLVLVARRQQQTGIVPWSVFLELKPHTAIEFILQVTFLINFLSDQLEELDLDRFIAVLGLVSSHELGGILHSG